MTRRSPVRFLAPLALVGVAVALVMIVSNGAGKSDETPVTPTTTVQRTAAKDAAKKKANAKKRSKKESGVKVYVVQAGDTPSGIAEETGVPLATIEELNPDLDPEALNVGDKIKLR